MDHSYAVVQLMKDFYRLTADERSTVKTMINEFITPCHSKASIPSAQILPIVALDIEYIHPFHKTVSYPMIHSLAFVDSAYRLPIFMIANHSESTLLTPQSRHLSHINGWVTTHNTHYSSVSEMTNMILSILRTHQVIMWDSEKDINIIGLHYHTNRIIDISSRFISSDGTQCGLRAIH